MQKLFFHPRRQEPFEIRVLRYLPNDRAEIEPVEPRIKPFSSYTSEFVTHAERTAIVWTGAIQIVETSPNGLTEKEQDAFLAAVDFALGSPQWFAAIKEIQF